MKKKKGFTLVELLAVIAILAILVIMALPAVLRMYRQSRINTFQNEVRGVYKSAQQQFLGDSTSLSSGQSIAYTNAGTTVEGKLMSLEEAKTFKNSGTTGAIAVQDPNWHYYWLGSADSDIYVWSVDYNGLVDSYSASSTYGVRPVIIVSTSDL